MEYYSGGYDGNLGKKGRAGGPDFGLIPVSLAAGTAAWFLCRWIYGLLAEEIARCLVIGIVFAAFCTVVSGVILFYSLLTKTYRLNVILADTGVLSAVATVFAGAVVLFGLGTLFQFIYALNFYKAPETVVSGPSSLIFVIDDSGSTFDTDPSGKRYSAISEVLSGFQEDIPFMVYSFPDGYNNVGVLRDMAPASAQPFTGAGKFSGSTPMKEAIARVLDDHESGTFDGGSRPVMILLSDGYPDDNKMDAELGRAQSAGIPIYTVGLMYADTDLMQKIADVTGGSYHDVQEASGLKDAMTAIVNEAHVTTVFDAVNPRRDLIKVRRHGDDGILPSIFRVLFLMVLAAACSLVFALVYGSPESVILIVIIGAVKGVLGAMVMEVGYLFFPGTPGEQIVSAAAWLIFAATFGITSGVRDRYDRKLRERNSSGGFGEETSFTGYY